MSSTQLSLQQVIDRIDQIPELPEVLLRVVEEVDKPNAGAESVGKLIRNDVGLTTQMLRLCNSAAYGFNRQIVSIRDAVAILGFNAVRSMVYAILAHRNLRGRLPGYGLGENDLWQNSVTCAFYAKHIAEKHRLCDPEHAFTGGIMRDLGKIALAEFVGNHYSLIEKVALEEQLPFTEAENRILGINHPMVGKKLAEKWKLPSKIIATIQYHHDPSTLAAKSRIESQQEVVKMVTAVHIADVFTAMAGHGIGRDNMMYLLEVEHLKTIGIEVTNAYVEQLMAELTDLNVVIRSFVESLSSVQGNEPAA